MSDLKGKTVGIPAIGASPDYALGFILKKYGLRAGEDLKITQTGGMPNSVAALEKRLVAAAMLSFPSRLLARKMGMVELVDLVEENWIYPASTLTVRREFPASQPDLLKRTVKSYLEGIHRYYGDRVSLFVSWPTTHVPVISEQWRSPMTHSRKPLSVQNLTCRGRVSR